MLQLGTGASLLGGIDYSRSNINSGSKRVSSSTSRTRANGDSNGHDISVDSSLGYDFSLSPPVRGSADPLLMGEDQGTGFAGAQQVSSASTRLDQFAFTEALVSPTASTEGCSGRGSRSNGKKNRSPDRRALPTSLNNAVFDLSTDQDEGDAHAQQTMSALKMNDPELFFEQFKFR